MEQNIHTLAEQTNDVYEKAAYEIVCNMIDSGLVESEPEGLDWEYMITEILKKHF